jgi:DNA-binding GntR family transcriptional regulator
VNVQSPAPHSLAETAYETLKRRIRTCDLLPGSRLTEKRLAQELGCGRTSVGEALARLANENFVRVIPRSGYEVTPLTLRDFEEVYEASRILWPAVIALAVERHSSPLIAQINALQLQSPTDWLEEARPFLQEVTRGTGNAHLAEICMRLFDEMERFFYFAIRCHGAQLSTWSYQMHEKMRCTLQRRAPSEAAQLATEIVDQTLEEFRILLHRLPSLLDTPLF